ncbi:MAG: HDIG domain-containing protein [Clostridiales bacterium]|nr:HDIG domain-containing protein [Clostridiales bacterium]
MINEKRLAREKRKKTIINLTIIFVFAILISFLITLKNSPLSPLIDENDMATRDTIVNQDYYDGVATKQKAQEEMEKVLDVVLAQPEKTYSAIESIIKYFGQTDTYRAQMSLAIQSDYATDEDREKILNYYIAYSNNFGVKITNSQATEVLRNISLLDYENFKNTCKIIFTTMQSEDINSENLGFYQDKFKKEFVKIISNNQLQGISTSVTTAFLRVNSIIDLHETQKIKDETYEYVLSQFPVVIKKGTKLTTKSEIVLKDTKRLLSDMSLLENEFNLLFYLLILGLVLIMVVLVILFKLMVIPKYDITFKQLLMISFVIIILFIFAFFIPIEYYLIIPFLIVPMMLSMLTNHRLAVVITIPIAILLTIMLNANVLYMTMIVVGGIISVYLVKNTSNRLRYAASGIIVGFINILIFIIMSYLLGRPIQTMFGDFAFIAIASILSSIIALGLLPVFESLFNVITPFKLLELSNPSQPLIKKMLLEAPGTYHHSLMVGNLAEVGAEAIGANGLLARVGAYYHDIGKLSRPGFFSENQTTKNNPHDKMNPSLSTFVITNHPKDGYELAKKHKLPHAIRDIILQHHGTTLVQYFYHKASQNDDANEKDFRYPGPRPSTKEAAVVLLADSVEASVRSMNKTSKGEIEGFIRKLIKEKLDDGQLDLCDLTLRNLDDIADAFTRVFSGYFHSRIQYPDKAEGVQIETVD